jgi:NADPH-dependent curcumin reductase
MTTNHRLLLAARPAGIPGPMNLIADAVPVRTPGPGEALLETLSLRQRLHVLEGLAQAPIGLGMLLRGENTGKLVVRVAAG